MKLPVIETAPALGVDEGHETNGLVRVTMACNERCPFCNVPMEDYEERNPAMDALEAQVDAFAASGQRTLTLSGGEPTLLKRRLLALTRRARAAGVPFVELQTNATLIDEAYAEEMADAGVTSAFVSLLSHLPEHHDALAGLEGAFEPCLRGIDAMHAAGISITLNPVLAAATASHVADYVDFVGERLPFVRSISVSAVQPHGRAAGDGALLPDYAVLREVLPRARERAAVHGITMLNPYCGLPACIGWSGDLDQSVEAFEAEVPRESVEVGPLNIQNVGNKSYGEPCLDCVLRPRCGGAWHAYWTVRGGSGIEAPARFAPPLALEDDARCAAGVVVRDRTGALDDESARAATTRWLRREGLDRRSAAEAYLSRATDLLVRVRSGGVDAEMLDAIAWLASQNATLAAARRLGLVIEVAVDGSFREAHAAILRLARAGATRIFVGHPARAKRDKFLAAMRVAAPDVRLDASPPNRPAAQSATLA